LTGALDGAHLERADLRGANLRGARLRGVHLDGANLEGADLSYAVLTQTSLHKATLTNCQVYGISVWDVDLTEADQFSLIITDPYSDPNFPVTSITVDNLEVAQFIYLLLNNKKIREVIDTITSKVVLILGRFTDERKNILDALRDELRKRNYSPVLFDFEKPASRNLTETISTLAHMARFVVADITEAKSVAQELQRIIPDLPSVPVQPLLQASDHEYGMFEDFYMYPWVLKAYRYQDIDTLLQSIQTQIVDPAEQKAKELAKR
jgi:Pentapeptide repeats (8 copies)